MPNSAEPIVKVLIDYNYYLKLKNLEDISKSVDEHKKKELNLVSEYKPNISSASTSSKHHTVSKQEPINKEKQNHFNFDDLVSSVTAAVTNTVLKKIEGHFPKGDKLKVSNQSGKGDVVPEVPKQINLPDDAAISFGQNQEKSVFQDSSDDDKLISTVPEKYQEKASNLLKLLKKHSLTFNYNSKGEIFIDQVSLPNSNFFAIFPELFYKRKKHVDGLAEVATKIASLGLGHLINFGIAKGLKRPKSFIEDPSTAHEMHNLKHWYYIGPA